MTEMINFGIDLGTTNSLIARFTKGEVEVFKNPNGFKETLPSVVGFRKERILVGEQAKTYLEKDPKSFVGRFKRKMGTTETFRFPAIGQSLTPIELSAHVLKELKTFIYSGESPQSVVITIPASFDLVQSNATKEAGKLAGFKQVILLQEPIAASLAYANKAKDEALKNSQWLVYDLGGGTFDVALVRIVEGELRVIDHEGDNYLGGVDFDEMIVSKLLLPRLEAAGQFDDLLNQMLSESGRHNRLWFRLLDKAEQVKVTLSTKTSADIDIEFEDDAGDEHDLTLTVTRSEFEDIIKASIDRTAEMIKAILTRNRLRPDDLGFVLMVGGSTYIPYVRRRVAELLQIPVRCDIDPTTAIAVGAAYFAATREASVDSAESVDPATTHAIRIKAVYNRASQDTEEPFTARIEGNVEGLFYRITRDDGGFDSGLKHLSNRISEDLPLKADAYNLFTFKVYDQKNDPVRTNLESIQIAQGRYSVAGQMLPEDISLVCDDLGNGDTRLQRLFRKNQVLPAKTTRTVDVNRTLRRDSSDDIKIIVVEGPAENHSSANKTVGHLVITGNKLSRDLPKGAEVNLTIELSESRDLTVSAYLSTTDQEFKQTFAPQYRDVPIETLSEEIRLLEDRIRDELEDATEMNDQGTTTQLKRLLQPALELRNEAEVLVVDDVRDERYKLEDRKRKVAQQFSAIESVRRMEKLRAEYLELRDEVKELVDQHGNGKEAQRFREIREQEGVIPVASALRLQQRLDELYSLRFSVLRRIPQFITSWFDHLASRRDDYVDAAQAESLIEFGESAIKAGNFDKVAEINFSLLELLPSSEQGKEKKITFTGISLQ